MNKSERIKLLCVSINESLKDTHDAVVDSLRSYYGLTPNEVKYFMKGNDGNHEWARDESEFKSAVSKISSKLGYKFDDSNDGHWNDLGKKAGIQSQDLGAAFQYSMY